MNTDKYGCLIQNPSNSERKKKNQYMLKHENGLTQLSLDTLFEAYGLFPPVKKGVV